MVRFEDILSELKRLKGLSLRKSLELKETINDIEGSKKDQILQVNAFHNQLQNDIEVHHRRLLKDIERINDKLLVKLKSDEQFCREQEKSLQGRVELLTEKALNPNPDELSHDDFQSKDCKHLAEEMEQARHKLERIDPYVVSPIAVLGGELDVSTLTELVILDGSDNKEGECGRKNLDDTVNSQADETTSTESDTVSIEDNDKKPTDETVCTRVDAASKEATIKAHTSNSLKKTVSASVFPMRDPFTFSTSVPPRNQMPWTGIPQAPQPQPPYIMPMIHPAYVHGVPYIQQLVGPRAISRIQLPPHTMYGIPYSHATVMNSQRSITKPELSANTAMQQPQNDKKHILPGGRHQIDFSLAKTQIDREKQANYSILINSDSSSQSEDDSSSASCHSASGYVNANNDGKFSSAMSKTNGSESSSLDGCQLSNFNNVTDSENMPSSVNHCRVSKEIPESKDKHLAEASSISLLLTDSDNESENNGESTGGQPSTHESRSRALLSIIKNKKKPKRQSNVHDKVEDFETVKMDGPSLEGFDYEACIANSATEVTVDSVTREANAYNAIVTKKGKSKYDNCANLLKYCKK